ncbi:MAG: MarR family transcriptional regulator [Chloroflexi bacterium]|nr:MarR family transcriptional regulator [Chloroflexota bacterium]
MICIPIIGRHMNPDKRRLFMMSVEIRILTSILTRISSRAVEERFSAHHADISGLQYGVLRMLGHQSFTISELSRHFAIDPSTLVPVIDSLERKSLVERGKDPNDRRRIPISLTEKGIALIQKMPFVHEEDLLFKTLDDMGEEKAQELLNLLREVIQKMPEGEEIVNSINSRLYILKEDGTSSEAIGCITRRRELENEHRHMIRRTNRRRERRNRS